MDLSGWHDLQAIARTLLAEVREPVLLAQLAIAVLALVVAWSLGRRWRHAPGHGLRVDLYQRVGRPAIVLLLAGTGALLLRALALPYQGLQLVAVLAGALALIRIGLYLLRRGLRPGPALAAAEHLISGAVWIAVALHVLGWLAPMLAVLDSLAIQFGDTRFSLLDLLVLCLVTGLLLILVSMLARLVERRVMATQSLSIGLRVGTAKVVRFSLVLLAVLVALNLAGINLTSLAVFSGALGVGIGFGLQRIASNFISGFILIMDRSIRPGDVITVGDSFGWVKELNARYVVVRNRDGVEMLIPNENLITSEVINWSYSDTSVRLKVPVSISYDDDPEQAMALLVEVALGHRRVVAEPAPVARLIEFGDSGIELELRVWIDDPQEGVNNIRSELNLGLWRAFKQAGITIPYPQRDLHVKSMPATRQG